MNRPRYLQAGRLAVGAAIVALAALTGCGAMLAQNPSSALKPVNAVADGGDERVILKGADVVAYFTQGRYVQGSPQFKSMHEGVTFRFASAEHKALFDAAPQKYEPQYGGFCASGAAFALKLGSDPTEFEIVDGRLFIFGDIIGHQAWSIDPAWNIRHGDEVWPEARDEGWRGQSLRRYGQKVAWYKDTAAIRSDWAAKFPGRPMADYDPGGMITNLFLKTPGWRAREGFGQPVVGFVGEDPCPPACAGAVSKRFGEP